MWFASSSTMPSEYSGDNTVGRNPAPTDTVDYINISGRISEPSTASSTSNLTETHDVFLLQVPCPPPSQRLLLKLGSDPAAWCSTPAELDELGLPLLVLPHILLQKNLFFGDFRFKTLPKQMAGKKHFSLVCLLIGAFHSKAFFIYLELIPFFHFFLCLCRSW